MRTPRSTIAKALVTAFLGIALFFVVTEHRAGDFGVWHYVLLLLCPALLYIATWNDGRSVTGEPAADPSSRTPGKQEHRRHSSGR